MASLNENEKKILMKIMFIISVLVIFYLLYYKVLPATFKLIDVILPALTPFIIAIIFAELLEPIINYLEKKLPINRTLSILIILVLLLALITFFLVILISRLVIELVKFSNTLSKHSVEIKDKLITIASDVENLYLAIELPDRVINSFEEIITQGLNFIKLMSGQLVSWFVEFLSFLPSGALLLLFALIAIFFFSRDKKLIVETIKKTLPGELYKKFELLFEELSTALIGFLRAQLILMFLTMVQTFIGLAILQVEYAVLLAIVVGIVDALPVLGPGAVFVPWILWEVVINKKFTFALALLLLYTIVSVVRQIMQPKIVGDSIGMHPLEALVSIYAGLKILGVEGVIVGPIIWVLVKAAWRAKIFKTN